MPFPLDLGQHAPRRPVRDRERPAVGVDPAVAARPAEREPQAEAAIVHDQLAEEPELLHAAGAVALLAQENAQLEAAWAGTLRDLQASRRRIVAASESERRRLERDLHDGAQQRLISVRIRLAIAREQAAADPAVGTTPGELEAELDGAIEELRDLAHGIFPSVLADRGLVPRCARWGGAGRDRSRSPAAAAAATRPRSSRPSTTAAWRRCRTRPSTAGRPRQSRRA